MFRGSHYTTYLVVAFESPFEPNRRRCTELESARFHFGPHPSSRESSVPLQNETPLADQQSVSCAQELRPCFPFVPGGKPFQPILFRDKDARLSFFVILSPLECCEAGRQDVTCQVSASSCCRHRRGVIQTTYHLVIPVNEWRADGLGEEAVFMIIAVSAAPMAMLFLKYSSVLRRFWLSFLTSRGRPVSIYGIFTYTHLSPPLLDITMLRETRGRPAIKPIRTDHSHFDLAGPSHRAVASLNSPAYSASPISPRTRLPPLQPNVHDNGMRLHDKTVVDRFDSNRAAFKTQWATSQRPVGEISLPTPLTAVPRHHSLSASIFEPTGGRRKTIAQGIHGLTIDPDDKPLPSPGIRSLGRRQSAPSGAAAFRHLRFQRFREDLWRQGPLTFGNPGRADNFVTPTELRRPFLATSTPGILSQSNKLTIRAVVLSKDRPPVSLTRNFDLDVLRATIPEPMPSPTVSHFDRGKSPIVMAARSGLLSPSTPAADHPRWTPSTTRQGSESVQTPMSAGPRPPRFPSVPIGKPRMRLAQLAIVK